MLCKLWRKCLCLVPVVPSEQWCFLSFPRMLSIGTDHCAVISKAQMLHAACLNQCIAGSEQVDVLLTGDHVMPATADALSDQPAASTADERLIDGKSLAICWRFLLQVSSPAECVLNAPCFLNTSFSSLICKKLYLYWGNLGQVQV